MLIVGCDISLEHAGFSFLNEKGQQEDYLYFTNVKRDFDENPSHAVLLDLNRKDGEDLDNFRMRRLCSYQKIFEKNILPKIINHDEVYFSIEGYAYGAITNALCQTAELMGQIKSLIYEIGGIMRVHDPISNKFFAVGKGNATKQEMFDKAKEENLVCFAPAKVKEKKVRKKLVKDLDGPLTDVVDAYFLARLLWYELQLRKGEILLKDLPEHQILTFNRVTKSYPVNILARPFIKKG